MLRWSKGGEVAGLDLEGAREGQLGSGNSSMLLPLKG